MTASRHMSILIFLLGLGACSSSRPPPRPPPAPPPPAVPLTPALIAQAHSFFKQTALPCKLISAPRVPYGDNLESVEIADGVLTIYPSYQYVVSRQEVQLGAVVVSIDSDNDIKLDCTIPGCVKEYWGYGMGKKWEVRQNYSQTYLSRCDEPRRVANALNVIVRSTPRRTSPF